VVEPGTGLRRGLEISFRRRNSLGEAAARRNSLHAAVVA
jgi:hypothetical protein